MMEPTTAAPSNPPPLRDTILTEKELANALPKCTVRKLRTWRNLRLGPPWLKIGREVVYLRASVEHWMQTNELNLDRDERPVRRVRKQRQPRRGSR